MVFEDLNVVWAVHWTKDKFFTVSHIHSWEHIFLVMIPVTRSLVKFYRSKWWSVNVLVARSQLLVDDVAFQFTTDSRTIWQPEWKTLTNFLRNHEEVKLFTKFTVVTFFSFFTHLKVVLQVFLVEPSCTVDTLHHSVVAISTPVSTSYIEKVEDLNATC